MNLNSSWEKHQVTIRSCRNSRNTRQQLQSKKSLRDIRHSVSAYNIPAARNNSLVYFLIKGQKIYQAIT